MQILTNIRNEFIKKIITIKINGRPRLTYMSHW